jgi:glycerol-3-phosphate acyltransferase PlsX
VADINIAVDAMGGDNSPAAAVGGCIAALDGRKGFSVTLAGQERPIYNELERLSPKTDHIKSGRLTVRHAGDIIAEGDAPVAAIKEKKNSSMVVSLRMISEGEAQAAVSAGNTGALLTGGLLVVGRLKGIMRPALGVMIPTHGGAGYYLLIDAGANMDSRPVFLTQFAHLGAMYFESLFDVPKPRVGLINVGSETEKGNALVKEAYPLLKASGLNFTGNVEARDLSLGGIDVAVCDGFVGNIILKYAEGFAKSLFTLIKNELTTGLINKTGAFLAKKAFVNLKASLDPSEVGGAPLLGLNSLVVKAHGNSDEKAWMNAVWKAVTYIENGAQNKLKEYFLSGGGKVDGA